MSGDEEQSEYSYDGQLVFNGIYSSKVINTDFDFTKVVNDSLTDFSVGAPDSPSDGYHALELAKYAKESDDVSNELAETVEHVRAIRHQYEEWEHKEIQQNGDIAVEPTRDVKSFDIYWMFPDFIAVKGDKTQSGRAGELLSLQLKDHIRVSEIKFEPTFLLWIFAQAKQDAALNDTLDPQMLTDCSVEGEERDRFGKKNSVDNSIDVTKSKPALMGLLEGKDLSALEGIYDQGGQSVQANISTEGRIHIKADQAVAEASDIKRMALSLRFIDALLRLYDSWQDWPAKERIPPIEFFEDIRDECEKQGAKIDMPMDHVASKYRELRNDDDYGGEQSGLARFI